MQAASLPGPIRQVRHGESVPWRICRHSIRALVEQIAVCLDNAVPVASDAWHVPVSVKV
jgi:hypothetical protein